MTVFKMDSFLPLCTFNIVLIGDPRVPGTLHDQATESLNDYEECIEGIGSALGQYCETCTIWGFGAKFDGVTRHLFQLGRTTRCHGSVDSILQAYRGVFQSDLTMSGPTLFAQVCLSHGFRSFCFCVTVSNLQI